MHVPTHRRSLAVGERAKNLITRKRGGGVGAGITLIDAEVARSTFLRVLTPFPESASAGGQLWPVSPPGSSQAFGSVIDSSRKETWLKISAVR